MKKRYLNLFIVLFLFQMLFSPFIITANAADNITETEVLEKLSSAETTWANGTTYVKTSVAGDCGQCFGFIRELFYYVFDATLPYQWSISTAKFTAGLGNVTEVGHLSKNYTLDELKTLIGKAKPGDVFVASNGSLNHGVIIRSVATDGSKIYVYDANWNHQNGIRTYAEWSAQGIRNSRSTAVTLYRYKNYTTTSTESEPPIDTSVTYADCNVQIACVSGKTVNLYRDPGDTSRVTYFSKGQSAVSTYCATLSDGSKWYRVTVNSNGTDKALWLKYESSKMTVTNITSTYIVTFNANGGNVSQRSKAVTSGSAYGTLPEPVRDGYTFDDWYTSASGGSKVTSSTMFNGSSNITLYAHWTDVPTVKNVKITFNANGGNTSQSSKTIAAGSYLTDLPTATRNGYAFLGWTMDKIDPNSSVTQSTVVISENMFSFDKDTTLYAYWRKNETPSYTVTFNANGGSVSQSSKSVTFGSSYGALPTPTRSSYTFDGWYTSASDGSKVTSSTTFNGSSNITLYAHWTAVSADVKITFDPNGGRTSQSSKTIAAGSYLTGLPTATRSGCTFLGWALDKIDPNASGTYSTTVVSEGTFSFDKDTTLYAYWRPDKPTTPEICTHTKGKFQYSDRTHPHYNYYSCSKCGETYTDYSTSADTSCESCWGPWSGWSTTPVYASSTRQVETRSAQISAGATEYRYGRYIDSTGGHICWCSTYLGSKGYSGITVQYSGWSTTRYGANGKVWTCGNCSGSHTGIDHYDSQGRPAWKEYSLSSGSYYWEESRQTSATYETQYRYRDLIS